MNDEQLMRYSRQLLLPQVDIEGQEKLQAAKVMIIGLGGLGSPVALYLAAAGVGELILCDFDKVDVSNLQRQVIHGSDSIDCFKVDSAINRLTDLNPECQFRGIKESINEQILSDELPSVDVVIDCTDNLSTRLLINKSCVIHQTPLVSGAAIRMEGQLSIFINSGKGPCYQCLFSDTNTEQETCSETGVLASTVGIIGTLQAQETLKLLIGIGKSQDGSMLLMDGMASEWRNMTVTKRSDCPVCG
ncbi:MAG: molybdopterin-synthase adenylyltransferase MoeB [Gammaproteobacteria bacterium]|nr:molybdopterin-synthase adenylyltransferase MoeB [Gammaproteobacteria bacterium]